MWYHGEGNDRADPASKRDAKERLVREDRAHASLVYDSADCVGWCQFGPPAELPRLHNSRAYLATNPNLPDWRVTLSTFESLGFERQRLIGKHKWVVSRTVASEDGASVS